MVLEDDSIVGKTYYYKPEALFYHGYGSMVEFFMRIGQYGTADEDSPIGKNTGVGIVLDDGSYQLALLFADAGNLLGKIVYLANKTDYDLALFDIMAGRLDSVGLYASIDWSIQHLYRLERTVGGKIRLTVDLSDTPLIEWDFSKFPFPASIGSGPRFYFGGLQDNKTNTSYWNIFEYTVSSGVDVMSKELIDSTTLERRFGQAGNIVVQADHT
jgi:hypothetical protein